MNEEHKIDELRRAVAAKNLSNLTFYYQPDTGMLHAELPANKDSRFSIGWSLASLGFNMDAANSPGKTGGVHFSHRNNITVATAMADAPTILFDEAGIKKLAEAGVQSPMLDFVARGLGIQVRKSHTTGLD